LDSAADSLLFSFKRMSSQYPERDPNAWLAWAIANRPGLGYNHEKARAAPDGGSLCHHPCGTGNALLGLDAVVEEHPELSRLASEKHRELYLPVEFAIKNGSFLKRWRESNPWTNENYPSVEQELKHGLLAGQSSGAVQKVRIICPNCRVELRIPGVTGGKKIRCPKCSSIFVVEP